MPLSREQKQVVLSFKDFTGSSSKDAVKFLKKYNWSINIAANSYFEVGPSFDNGSGSAPIVIPSINKENVNVIFNKYAIFDEDGDKIESTNSDSLTEITDYGIEAFYSDLGISIDDVVTLIVSWKMKAANMCIYTRKEFVRGFEALQCNNISEIKAKIPSLRREIENETTFKNFYMYVFGFSCDEGQRSLPLETAIELWKLLIINRFKHIGVWCEFLQTVTVGISRDTWEYFYEWCKLVGSGLSHHDEEGAWPSIVDDFMEWVKENPVKTSELM